MLSAKQGDIKYHFLSLWYDSTWDWIPVSRAIGEHSTQLTKCKVIYRVFFIINSTFFDNLYLNYLNFFVALVAVVIKKQSIDFLGKTVYWIDYQKLWQLTRISRLSPFDPVLRVFINQTLPCGLFVGMSRLSKFYIEFASHTFVHKMNVSLKNNIVNKTQWNGCPKEASAWHSYFKW